MSGRDRLRLTTRIGDGDRIARVVDDDGVVNVVVNNIRRRRCDIDRRIVIGGDRNKFGNRQDEKPECRRWRCQAHEFRRRRCQEKYRGRRWRNETVVWIIKNQHRPAEIHHFFFWRRSYIVCDRSERRRRFIGRGEIAQSTVRVGHMRTARIPAEVGPISLRRIDDTCAPPGNRLAASGHDGTNPWCHRIAGISGEKIEVALKRISLQRSDVRILNAEIPNSLRADRGNLIVCEGRRRRVWSAIEKYEWRVDLRGIPRHLAAFCHFVDAKTNLIKHCIERQSAGTDHLGKGLSVGAVRSLFLRCNGAGGGVECDQHALVRLHQRQAACKRLAGFCEGMRARRIENDNVGPQFERRKRPDVIGHAHRLDRDIGVARDLCIDRHKVVFAFELNAVAAQVNKRHGIGARSRRLVQEVVQRAAQCFLIEIAGAYDIKARSLKSLRDQARVIRSGR